MLDRLLEALARLQQEEERAMREQSEDVGARVEAAAAHIKGLVESLDNSTRISLACVAAGVTMTVVSATIPAIGNVGEGYFLRAGILLAGIGLHMLLRPRE